jgi:hypothetical protein
MGRAGSAELGASELVVTSIDHEGTGKGFLHYDYIRQAEPDGQDFSAEGNIEFLRRGTGFSKVQSVSLPEIRSYLNERGIPCQQICAHGEQNYVKRTC